MMMMLMRYADYDKDDENDDHVDDITYDYAYDWDYDDDCGDNVMVTMKKNDAAKSKMMKMCVMTRMIIMIDD
jgi:hypothetical protein